MTIELYNFPPSFYSQIARVALHEAGVEYRDRLVVTQAPFYDHFHPEFARLNPEMTVPAARFEGEPVLGSMAIARRASATGTSLIPTDVADEVEDWVARYEALPMHVIVFAGFARLDPKLTEGWKKRAVYLRAKLATKVPVELRRHYESKIEQVERFVARGSDPERVAAAQAELDDALDALDARLVGREFIVGDSFTLADGVWAVTIARQLWLARAPFVGRTDLEAWYQQVRQRPAFVAANVWEKREPAQVLRIALRRLGPLVVAVGVVIAAMALLIAWR